jgi:CheY-like chemotaxis protein
MKGAQTGETILFAEDNPDDQYLFERSVRRLPFKVEVRFANDGEQAIAYLKGETEYADRSRFPLPSVIFLDIKMPKKSGFEVLQWIKTSSPDHLRRIPVVMLSSSDHQSDIDRTYDLGASAYLVKPSGFQELHSLFKATGECFLEHVKKPSVHPT